MIDVHTHFFNRDMLSDNVTRHLENLAKLQKILPDKGGQVSRLVKFINAAFTYYETDLLKKFEESYGPDCIVVPLMLDISYVADEADKSIKFLKSSRLNDILNNIKHELVQKGSFQAQIDSLVRMKKKFPYRIFPFFSIDPRQQRERGYNIMGLLEKYVGPDKPFRGVKLYSSCGFSPTDPLLYSSDPRQKTVYHYCLKNGIPITLHFSNEGFSTLASTCNIHGDVYDPKSGNICDIRSLTPDGVLRFEKSHNMDFDNNPAIEERLLKLNHPKLWEKVLKKYPKLYINFAHFGGSDMNGWYLQSPEKGFWTDYVLKFIKKYPNAYTDLSCFIENTCTLDEFKKGLYDKLPKNIKKKIMYGSDYHILRFTGDDLPEYFKHFKNVFGKDFKNISDTHIRKFLKI